MGTGGSSCSPQFHRGRQRLNSEPIKLRTNINLKQNKETLTNMATKMRRLDLGANPGAELAKAGFTPLTGGSLKEELDAPARGSGFSFGDLSADWAGVRFAQAVTASEAAALKIRTHLQSGCAVDDFFPRPRICRRISLSSDSAVISAVLAAGAIVRWYRKSKDGLAAVPPSEPIE